MRLKRKKRKIVCARNRKRERGCMLYARKRKTEKEKGICVYKRVTGKERKIERGREGGRVKNAEQHAPVETTVWPGRAL